MNVGEVGPTIRCSPRGAAVGQHFNLRASKGSDNANHRVTTFPERPKSAFGARACEMTFMKFHLPSMSFRQQKPQLTWGNVDIHRFNLRPVILLICSPP